MKKNIVIYLVLLFVTTASFSQCSDPVSVPPDIPIETLLTTPDTLTIENQSYVLSTYLWRDFQPVSPPNGKPLIALVYVQTTDSSVISSSIDADAVYMVYNDEVWKSYFTNEPISESELRPFRIAKIAREGPKWGPNVYVEVIVSIRIGSKQHLLRAPRQFIERTD